MTGSLQLPTRKLRIASAYVAFALLATVINLGTQEFAFRAAPGLPVMFSIVTGTVAGFVVKYALDKIWIFDDQYDGARAETRKIALYGFFSIATTAIFWGAELLFLALWGTAAAKYTGAILGLAIGYAVKYEIDRRYVFRGAPVGNEIP